MTARPLMAGRLREIAAPFVVARPAGTRVRTRLRVDERDAEVLTVVGRHLGSLAGADLARRCAQGRLDAQGQAASRRLRKQALTAGSSSRWAGAITRSSEDAYQLTVRNLDAERNSLKARITAITRRLAVPAGQQRGRTRGYATQAERYEKQRRLQSLRRRLAEAESRAEAGADVGVPRGPTPGPRPTSARGGQTEPARVARPVAGGADVHVCRRRGG